MYYNALSLCMQALGSLIYEPLLAVIKKGNPCHGQAGYTQKFKTNNTQIQLRNFENNYLVSCAMEQHPP